MKNKWRTVAIIFIIITIVETLGIIWIYNLGMESIENENECAYNICAEQQTYQYDSTEKMCYCFENHEVVYQEYMP